MLDFPIENAGELFWQSWEDGNHSKLENDLVDATSGCPGGERYTWMAAG